MQEGGPCRDRAAQRRPYRPRRRLGGDGRRRRAGVGTFRQRRAFGEHKGSGLAFICELLGGALTGTGATSGDRRFANGMFAVYVDPKVIDTGNFFDGEISRYVDFTRATKPVAGVDAVLIPGD